MEMMIEMWTGIGILFDIFMGIGTMTRIEIWMGIGSVIVIVIRIRFGIGIGRRLGLWNFKR